MTTRERLHQLVDELCDGDMPTAERILTALRDTGEDPVLRAVWEAPLDDEPESDEERAAVAKAMQDENEGRLVSHEEARRRLLGRP